MVDTEIKDPTMANASSGLLERPPTHLTTVPRSQKPWQPVLLQQSISQQTVLSPDGHTCKFDMSGNDKWAGDNYSNTSQLWLHNAVQSQGRVTWKGSQAPKLMTGE